MEVYFSAADQLSINIVDSVSISKQCQYKLASHQIVDSQLKLSFINDLNESCTASSIDKESRDLKSWIEIPELPSP